MGVWAAASFRRRSFCNSRSNGVRLVQKGGQADAFAAVFPTRPARPTRASLRGSEEILGRLEMKQRDLRTHIIREWDAWLQNQAIQPGTATGRDSLKFYFELQDKRSTLLNFQSRGRDKWQIVHSWLLSKHRVID